MVGKTIRIDRLGCVDASDTVITMSALKMAMRKFEASVELGKGVAEAQEILLEGY